ncbi:MAG TPA: hypothetical protein PLC99_20590 [Verrucomicrobiota bacterium]|nr:hypothetical protein [Verrucomicrobiota bacterium]
MNKAIPVLLQFFFFHGIVLSSCNDPENTKQTTGQSALGESFNTEDSPDQPNTGSRLWKTEIPKKELCGSISDVSLASTWQLESIPGDSTGPFNEDSFAEAPEDIACILGRSSRVAIVTIEGIIRDYINEEHGTKNWTIYRLQVHETISGRLLPNTIYAAAITGRCQWNSYGTKSCRRYSTSLRTVGEKGIALLGHLGYDPIRAQATLDGSSGLFPVIPARILAFGLFLPEKDSGNLDSQRENTLFGGLTAQEVPYDSIRSAVERIGSAECPQAPTVCVDCDTSQACLGSSFEQPCGCINDLGGCLELEPEDARYCQLFDPASEQ